MLVLINSSSIFPIDDAVAKNEPIRIFESFYIQKNVDISVPFSTWLNSFILPINATEESTEKLSENISEVLSDPMLLRQATLRLFPVQYEFNEENWPHIQIEMARVIRNKKARKVTMASYQTLNTILTNGINRVLSL